MRLLCQEYANIWVFAFVLSTWNAFSWLFTCLCIAIYYLRDRCQNIWVPRSANLISQGSEGKATHSRFERPTKSHSGQTGEIFPCTWSVYKNRERRLFFQTVCGRSQHQVTPHTTKQGSIWLNEENNINLQKQILRKQRYMNYLKEYKTAITKMISEIQKAMHGQNENRKR